MVKRSISVIIPVHRQAELVRETLPIIYSFLRENFDDFEMILIDSEGNDGSSEFCDDFSLKNPNVIVVHDSVNTKFGAKLEIGYKKATKDLIWPVVLDIPFPLEKILEAEKFFDKYDVVLSYRLHDPRGWIRRFQSLVYNLIIRVSLGIRVRHANSAFRVYKREFIQKLNLISDGWFIDAEVVYYITKMQMPYIEIPVPLVQGEEKYKSSIGVTTFLEVLGEMFYFLRNKKI